MMHPAGSRWLSATERCRTDRRVRAGQAPPGPGSKTRGICRMHHKSAALSTLEPSMPDTPSILDQLVALTRSLGDPARDLAILGEGNTSAQLDSDAFLVKASGREMRTADADSFVAVSLPRALDVL